jgi:hypothetical protein
MSASCSLSAVALRKGDFGSATSILFDELRKNQFDAELESHLCVAMTAFTGLLRDEGHVAQALWIWSTALDLLRGRSISVQYQFGK